MSYKIKALLPAEPGWRVLFDGGDDNEQPIIGWALVRYRFKDPNDPKPGKEEEIFPVCPGPYAGACTAIVAVSEHGSIPDCGYTVVGILRPGQAADALADKAERVRAREDLKHRTTVAETGDRIASFVKLEKLLLRALKTQRDPDEEDDPNGEDEEQEKVS
jgi:hypothetical protein